MLNSTKTWQEKFDENFEETTITIETDSGWTTIPCSEEIKQFISDLRKKDMEAMLKITDDYYDGEGIEDWNKRLQLIKDYYENKRRNIKRV